MNSYRWWADWFHEGKPVWILFAGFFVTWMMAYAYRGSIEAKFIFASFLLQLLGVLLILMQTQQIRREFNMDGVLFAWLSKLALPRDFSNTVIRSAIGKIAVTLDGVIGVGIARPGKTATVEERLESLQANYENLTAAIAELRSEVHVAQRELADGLASDQRTLSSRVEQLGQQLRRSLAGGLGYQLVGAAWLGAGAILSWGAVHLAHRSL